MADEESQVEEDTSWWAIEAFPDVELPSMSLDEPLEWPDSLPWEEFSSGARPADPPGAPADLVFPIDAAAEAAADTAPAPDSHVEWQADGYDPDKTMAATALAGLGGGATEAAAVDPATEVQPLPDSIWSFDSEQPARDDSVAGLASLHAPLVYAETDGRGRIQGLRRFDISRGNVAIVALISAVSLVLLGMFLSVRSRNDVPTDATASPPRTDQIATANTRNSVPVTTTAVTTTVPGPSINIADLVPPADTAPAGTTGTAGTAGTGTTARTPVATTTPTRSNTAPAGGGGGSSGVTQPAPQSPATTAAPEPPPDTTPVTSPPPPPDDTTNTTTRPRVTTPPPTFVMPTIPDYTSPGGTGTSIPRPGFTFPSRDDD